MLLYTSRLKHCTALIQIRHNIFIVTSRTLYFRNASFACKFRRKPKLVTSLAIIARRQWWIQFIKLRLFRCLYLESVSVHVQKRAWNAHHSHWLKNDNLKSSICRALCSIIHVKWNGWEIVTHIPPRLIVAVRRDRFPWDRHGQMCETFGLNQTFRPAINTSPDQMHTKEHLAGSKEANGWPRISQDNGRPTATAFVTRLRRKAKNSKPGDTLPAFRGSPDGWTAAAAMATALLSTGQINKQTCTQPSIPQLSSTQKHGTYSTN